MSTARPRKRPAPTGSCQRSRSPPPFPRCCRPPEHAGASRQRRAGRTASGISLPPARGFPDWQDGAADRRSSARSPCRGRTSTNGSEGDAAMRVLLVDDDPMFLQSAARRPAPEAGFTVVGRAGNGADAIQLAMNLSPDLVVLDVEMPGMDGLETARRLKALPLPPRVLLVSIHDDEARRFAALSVGA